MNTNLITLDDLKAYYAARNARESADGCTPEQRKLLERFAGVDLMASAIYLIEQRDATITAQSRLLALAETLAGAADKLIGEYFDGYDVANNLYVADPVNALEAFTAALTEYQTTGTVPCGECAKWQTEAQTLGETIDELLKASGSEHKRLMKTVYGFNEDATFSDTLTVIEKMRQRLAEAQTDNAALVEVLEWTTQTDHEHPWTKATMDALAQPHPGAALLEELAALRKVADDLPEIAPAVDCYGTEGERLTLAEMKQTLDAIRNREGR